MNKTAVRKKQYIDQNTIESQRNVGSGTVQHFSNIAKDMGSDMWSQLLSPMLSERNGRQEVKGDLVEGQEVTLSKLTQNRELIEKKAPVLDVEPGIDYKREILHGERKIAHRETQEIITKIQEIIIELKRLTSTSKVLEVEFKEISTEQRISSPGKYHVSFFEWILSVIKQARMKVEDSGAWLAVAKSKHAKRRDYWAMANEKVAGTSFSLTGERVVATQTG